MKIKKCIIKIVFKFVELIQSEASLLKWKCFFRSSGRANHKFIKYIALTNKSRLSTVLFIFPSFFVWEIWKFYSFITVCIFNLIYENDSLSIVLLKCFFWKETFQIFSWNRTLSLSMAKLFFSICLKDSLFIHGSNGSRTSRVTKAKREGGRYEVSLWVFFGLSIFFALTKFSCKVKKKFLYLMRMSRGASLSASKRAL